MGTNGAFGGSGAATWEAVRQEWESLGVPDSEPSESSGDGGDAPTADGDSQPYDALVQAIAQALIGEDPDARQPTVPQVPLSSVLPSRRGGRGGGGGGGAAGGTAGGGSGSSRSMSGTRRVTAQAARGGSAIGAATAYRNRDAAALAEFGLSLDELDSLSPRMRCARILDMAIGQAGHPDEQALRHASLEQIKALTAGSDDPQASGLESLRAFIGELTVRLGLVELRDQYLAKDLTAKQTLQREKGLRQWVKAKIARMDIGKYGRVSPTEFHQVAKQMSADALRLLRGE